MHFVDNRFLHQLQFFLINSVYALHSRVERENFQNMLYLLNVKKHDFYCTQKKSWDTVGILW